jgi:hypothetical protein
MEFRKVNKLAMQHVLSSSLGYLPAVINALEKEGYNDIATILTCTDWYDECEEQKFGKELVLDMRTIQLLHRTYIAPLVPREGATGALTYYLSITSTDISVFKKSGRITGETEQALHGPPPEIQIPAGIQVHPRIEISGPSEFPDQENSNNKYVGDDDYSIDMPGTGVPVALYMGTYSVAHTEVTKEETVLQDEKPDDMTLNQDDVPQDTDVTNEETVLEDEKPDDMALTQDDVPQDGESTMTTDCTKFNNLEHPVDLYYRNQYKYTIDTPHDWLTHYSEKSFNSRGTSESQDLLDPGGMGSDADPSTDNGDEDSRAYDDDGTDSNSNSDVIL